MWKSSHEEKRQKRSEREYCSMLNNLNIVICIREIMVSSDQISFGNNGFYLCLIDL